MGKIMVLGASPNPERFSYMAVKRLINKGYEVEAIGIRKGNIEGVEIQTNKIPIQGIHTILMYIAPKKQPEYYNYIVHLNPKRVIFNPGTENPELVNLLSAYKIEICFDCALIMLTNDTF